MTHPLLILMPLLGGMLYRFRGGITALLPYFGDFIPRAVFACATGAWATYCMWDFATSHIVSIWWLPIAMTLSTFLAEIIPNYSSESELIPCSRWNIFSIAIVRAFIISWPLIWMEREIEVMLLLAAGMFAGVVWVCAYFLAHNIQIMRFGYKPDGTKAYIIDGYWSFGEYVFGVLIWTALLLPLFDTHL